MKILERSIKQGLTQAKISKLTKSDFTIHLLYNIMIIWCFVSENLHLNNTKGIIAMNVINIAEGINLYVIQSDKFKTNLLKINFTIPLSAETAPYAALLPAVLRRGSKKHPTMLEFNRSLEYLYASSLSGGASKVGENETITFNASFLRNELIPDGTDLLSDVIEATEDFIFNPYLENGIFSEEYVESEKKNLCDQIEAEINTKGVYAVKRLFDIMCKDEPYSISSTGTVESVSTLTAEGLYSFYKNEFAAAPIEIFFVGTCDEAALCEKLTADEFEHYTQVVAAAERRGKHYTKKTHYQAILDMAIKDRAVFKGG